jgi:hypothetical protein
MECMRIINAEVAGRLKKLTEDREKKEEEVLALLEKVCNVTMSSATSTLL